MRAASRLLFIALSACLAAPPCHAETPPIPSRSPLNAAVTVHVGLRVAPRHEDINRVRHRLPAGLLMDWDRFSSRTEAPWTMIVDLTTGRPALMEGKGIPWIAGEGAKPSVDDVAAVALGFLETYPGLFGVAPSDLTLNRIASGPVLDYLYGMEFQWTFHSIPVDGARLVFRLNHGRLIQMGQENIGPDAVAGLDPRPSLPPEAAWNALWNQVGGPRRGDRILSEPALSITPFALPDGGLGYRLIYRMAFERPGSGGTWEGRVDAHSGEVLSFVDTNLYGSVHGGIYPADGATGEVDRPFPFADIGGGLYADGAGRFTGAAATTTLSGPYVAIHDYCGSIALSTSTGDADFLTGPAGEDNCAVPAGNTAGAGNTHAARTQYFAINQIKRKALAYLPSHVWLAQPLTVNVNMTLDDSPENCPNGAWWGEGETHFCVGDGKPSPGEFPSLAMHEFGHGLDRNDGTLSPDEGSGETYADFTAMTYSHDSCMGRGMHTDGSFCDGHGDACTSCTGSRDMDWGQHASGLPHFAEDMASNVCAGCTTWVCPTKPDYAGPCGYEGHCEALIASEALWDLANRDLPAMGLPQATAWLVAERLWYASRPSAGSAYACPSLTATDGCGTGSLYTVLRFVDDADDDPSNGTPHAGAIYAALARHKIACGAAGDAANQSVTDGCPSFSPDPPALSGLSSSSDVQLAWSPVAGASSYAVFRSDNGCALGFTRVSPDGLTATTWTDALAADGITYYYRVQAVGATQACEGRASACLTIEPWCAGTPVLDKTAYRCSDVVNVAVRDSSAAASVTVKFWSTTDGTQKTLTLTNTPAGSDLYTGHFHTTTGAAGADQVQVAEGGSIAIRYTDPDQCGTASVNTTVTAGVDCTAPAISGVQVVNITGAAADVVWTTNEPADGTAVYDTASPPSGSSAHDASAVTAHTLTLTGLAACTKYYALVRSADPAGNQASDTNGGAYYKFATRVDNPLIAPRTEDPPLAIPDPGSASSSQTVTAAATLLDVNVTVNLAHPRTSDLSLDLVGPDGTTVNLSYRRGAGADFTDTVFDDEASIPISGGASPFTGSFRPDVPLSAFDGEGAAGIWRLNVYDLYSPYPGTILDWTLTLTLDVPPFCGHVITSVTTGNWSNRDTWDWGIPAEGDHVVVANGHAVGLNVNPAPLETLTLAGALSAGSHSLALAGDWTTSGGGSFDPGTGTVSFQGGDEQTLTGDTIFHDLVVGSGSILATASNVTLTGTLLNNGWTRETRTVTGTGPIVWGLAGLTTDITLKGSLASLEIRRRDADHPNATPRLLTGRYWTLTPTGSGFSADLSLPQASLTAPVVCRWGTVWECAAMASTASTVTRTGVTAFSDWTVGTRVASPPVGNGRSGTTAALFSKDAVTPGKINVSYDAVHCTAQKTVILYGTISDYAGYAGCASTDAESDGTASFDGAGLNNVWFNLVWSKGTAGGHPGFAASGGSQVQRTWTTAGFCGMTADNQADPVCD